MFFYSFVSLQYLFIFVCINFLLFFHYILRHLVSSVLPANFPMFLWFSHLSLNSFANKSLIKLSIKTPKTHSAAASLAVLRLSLQFSRIVSINKYTHTDRDTPAIWHVKSIIIHSILCKLLCGTPPQRPHTHNYTHSRTAHLSAKRAEARQLRRRRCKHKWFAIKLS